MRNNLYWSLVIVSAISAAGIIFYFNQNFYQEFLSSTSKLDIPQRVSRDAAWIELDFGNGNKRMFEGKLGKETYWLNSALKAVSQEAGIDFKVNQGEITKVGDINNNGGAWKIYRNGQHLKETFDKLLIAAGDRYTIRWEK